MFHAYVTNTCQHITDTGIYLCYLTYVLNMCLQMEIYVVSYLDII